MKRFLTLACAGVLLCAPLGGCGTLNGTNARITAGKSIADAWAALDGAAQVADAAVHAGVLHGSQAATVSSDLKLASASLTAATTAYQAGNNGNAAVQIAEAASAVASILTIVGQAQGSHQ